MNNFQRNALRRLLCTSHNLDELLRLILHFIINVTILQKTFFLIKVVKKNVIDRIDYVYSFFSEVGHVMIS